MYEKSHRILSKQIVRFAKSYRILCEHTFRTSPKYLGLLFKNKVHGYSYKPLKLLRFGYIVSFLIILPVLCIYFTGTVTCHQRWARSRIRSGIKVWLHVYVWSRIRIFKVKPDSEPDPDFSLNLKPKYYVSLLLSIFEKRNSLVPGSG